MGKFDRLKSITVLYVEDSKFLAKTTVGAIKNVFANMYIAYDGQEGYELFLKHQGEIDIIITDLIMPQLSGTEMIKKIRQQGFDTPVIVTTGFDDFLERENMTELSIEAFLSKPINTFRLLKSINKVVDSLFIKRELHSKKEMIDKDIIYSETDERGVITYVSKPFEKISGYTRNELIGKTHAILKHGETPDFIYEQIWSNLKSHKQWQGEITNRTKEGKPYTISIVITPRYFRNALIGYSSTSIDVTELRVTSKELQVKSKQAAMGEMVAMIAHQWRQPITSIGMIANNLEFDLMMDELDKDALKESLQTIDSHVKYLSNTINIFRNFLNENKQEKNTKIADVFAEVIMLVKEICTNHGISLEINNRCQDLEITTFKDELIQALLNIVTNACEALMAKGIAAPRIKIDCKEEDAFLIIEIADNAGGIPQEILPKIFTPYFSTKQEKHGTGLGLYMTRVIIEENLMGLLLVSNKDSGALFKITIPTRRQR